MPSKPSSALLFKAFKRGDFTFRGLANALEKQHGIGVDHKTIGSYVAGKSRPKKSTYRHVALLALKDRKEREEYLLRWNKETEKEEKQTRKRQEIWRIIWRAKRKGITAKALVTRGGKLDGEHRLEPIKNADGEFPAFKPKVTASVHVEWKKEIMLDGEKLSHKNSVIEIHSDGSISLECAMWPRERDKRYSITKDIPEIMRIFREFCAREGLEPRGLLEVAKEELEQSPWLDPATHSEGKRVLVDIYTMRHTQMFLAGAADRLREGKKDEAFASRLDFWAGDVEGYLQPDLLIGFKEEITKTLDVLIHRFPM